MMFLKIGASGPEVSELQDILKREGYYTSRVDGDFGELTEKAVMEFQGGHIDQNKVPLKPDGEVGEKTWWALKNPSGEPQKSHIVAILPLGLTVMRSAALSFLLKLHAQNVREVPKGSNGGDGVDAITGGWKAPWCMMTVSYIIHEALGMDPFGFREAACINAYETALEKGWWRPKETYTPIPGDVFIMLYKRDDGTFNRKGHTGFVVNVSVDGLRFNTGEGNCGDRLKLGIRGEDQHTLEGYINFWPPDEQPADFERKIVLASQVAKLGTR